LENLEDEDDDDDDDLQGVHPVVFVYTFFYYLSQHNNYQDLFHVSSVKLVY
jgi:hypothetical protein